MKYLLVIGDGMADGPVPELGGLTPLQKARVPAIGRMAARGTVGRVVNCPPPLPAGSETALLSILGCDPRAYFSGRAPLEAAAAGIVLRPGDGAFRCNLVTLEDGDMPLEEKRLLSHSAGSIAGEAALEAVAALLEDPRFSAALAEADMELHPFPVFRQLAVRHGCDLTGLRLTPPHDHLGQPCGPLLPAGRQAEPYTRLMRLAHEILDRCPASERRRAAGEFPANGVWFWAEGAAAPLPGFRDQYGLDGAVVSAVPVCRGIGLLRGLEAPEVEGATGELDTNFPGKLEAAWEKLQEHGFVCLHLEAPDECTHNGDLAGKVRAIELLDSRLVSPLLERLERAGLPHRVLLLSDHRTLTATRGHDGGPVPFLLYDSRRNTGSGASYDERAAEAGPFVANGHTLLDVLFEKQRDLPRRFSLMEKKPYTPKNDGGEIMNQKFENLGLRPANILLPKAGTDMEKWAVVACDQFTSQPEYWEEVERLAGDAPSTLRLILPESRLNDANVDGHISNINRSMEDYLARDIFQTHPDAIIYIERTQSDGAVRPGLVAAVDLEKYDYTPGSGSLIRATEGTVLERIPPRVRVRKDAPIELPHVMLLIDDPRKTCIEPITAAKDAMEQVYDFELMMKGGHLRGWKLSSAQQDALAGALEKLASEEAMKEKYGLTGAVPLLFAVGDGNHSLATAKTCYENLKKVTPEDQWASLPARYALVEIENLHDASLKFEAIHRVVFGVDPEKLLAAFKEFYPTAREGQGVGHTIAYTWSGGSGYLNVPNPRVQLAVGTLQNFLDVYLKENGGEVDYIHGGEITDELGSKPGNIGFKLPAMGKDQLFKTVIADGVLPRKTFSMGHAEDKRYYVEGRKIR